MDYVYRGARALVLLHEREMRHFLEAWRRAKAAKVALPKTDDPDYQSLDHVLRHVLRASRGYMTWMCEKLELPDPGISPAPETEVVEKEAARYVEHLLARWKSPLAEVEEERFHKPCYTSRWGVDYCLDSMLEHAVMHPLRHTFQLEELMSQQGR